MSQQTVRTKEAAMRRVRRTPAQIPVVVEFRATDGATIREVTRSVNVSSLGMSFVIKRTFVVGQIVCLTLPLPLEMRRYDVSKPEYCVWGVIRYSNKIRINDSEAHQIGVAFIGRDAPRGYERDPATLYDVTLCPDFGLWEYAETGQTIDRRQHRRYEIPVEVDLLIDDAANGISTRERTVTENICVRGASVYSAMRLRTGDFVKFVARQYNVALDAEVKSLTIGDDGIQRLHLMFTSGTFPLEGIEST